MSCPEHEILCAFADGELDAPASTQVEAHLAGCTTCRDHVEQFQWLNSFGPSALKAIGVNYRLSTVGRTLFTTQHIRPLGLAMVAVVLIGLSIGVWFISQQATEGEKVSTPTKFTAPIPIPVQKGGRVAPLGNASFTSDEAFERWAGPYRRLRIPLVPMEVVPKSFPPEILPIQPLTPKRNGTG